MRLHFVFLVVFLSHAIILFAHQFINLTVNDGLSSSGQEPFKYNWYQAVARDNKKNLWFGITNLQHRVFF